MVGVVEVVGVVGGGQKAVVVVKMRLWRRWLALWLRWLIQNNDSKRKMATSKITARMTRIIPFKHRWGNLSEHRLIDITDLGTFVVFCEFPQP